MKKLEASSISCRPVLEALGAQIPLPASRALVVASNKEELDHWRHCDDYGQISTMELLGAGKGHSGHWVLTLKDLSHV